MSKVTYTVQNAMHALWHKSAHAEIRFRVIKCKGALRVFQLFDRETILCGSLIASLGDKNLSKTGSTLKGKNLLLKKQILFF